MRARRGDSGCHDAGAGQADCPIASGILCGCDIIEWDAQESRRAYGRVIPSEPGLQLTMRRQPIGPVADALRGIKDSGYAREGGREGLTRDTVVKNVSHLTA